MFKGILISKNEDGKQSVSVSDIDESQLMEGDVTVRVDFSTINFKDGLGITGASPIIRTYPMVPGIDFSGVVESSESAEFKPGDRVVLNGWGVGEGHWGGLAQKARVQSNWLRKIPAEFSNEQAMAIGTAGYTAALCVQALLDNGVQAKDGEILVTGATGGVGSVAVALLSKLGFNVAASSGKASESDFLQSLGATTVINRANLSEKGKPLQKERWAAVVDCVGSFTLANACAQTRYGGYVAACGLAQGADLPATVMPFILRGVTLLGIDSVMAPNSKRDPAWTLLAEKLEISKLEAISRRVGLADAIKAAEDILAGKIRGRVVVDVNA